MSQFIDAGSAASLQLDGHRFIWPWAWRFARAGLAVGPDSVPPGQIFLDLMSRETIGAVTSAFKSCIPKDDFRLLQCVDGFHDRGRPRDADALVRSKILRPDPVIARLTPVYFIF